MIVLCLKCCLSHQTTLPSSTIFGVPYMEGGKPNFLSCHVCWCTEEHVSPRSKHNEMKEILSVSVSEINVSLPMCSRLEQCMCIGIKGITVTKFCRVRKGYETSAEMLSSDIFPAHLNIYRQFWNKSFMSYECPYWSDNDQLKRPERRLCCQVHFLQELKKPAS